MKHGKMIGWSDRCIDLLGSRECRDTTEMTLCKGIAGFL